MRLDKFLSNMGIGTRTEVKKQLLNGWVRVNGIVETKGKAHIDPEKDVIRFGDQVVGYKPFIYIMLNKPQGYISATEDRSKATVLDLIDESYLHYDLFPAGRLDRDTVGLLLLTNDGQLAHKMLSPKYHVGKTYKVTTRDPLTIEDLEQLEKGVVIPGEYLTKPAKAKLQEGDPHTLYLTISEGKYHQVKEMLIAIDNEVVFLERVTFGPLSLDADLERGESRELKEEEIIALMESAKGVSDEQAT
ncbi:MULTISPECIES: pseudouridine synthase [unclassified Fusibacter]|uniref:pseudouridine synthase n=1 Tax=unclassified Fusibacter TaxID=2624464 RepID=UPI0010112B57|nr:MULTISPECIES: pseudouridine synthase [unclassified Fusibacter]MCK8060593.1 rRNA pseudouridine synthase [Fusibacter sp. A2]NPE22953.1 rRNA pseudouridine synthase [Fusibacter sp. A1]RXV60084.1 rRNA pseudouridine synthase [Fusibacter sp. A1]